MQRELVRRHPVGGRGEQRQVAAEGVDHRGEHAGDRLTVPHQRRPEHRAGLGAALARRLDGQRQIAQDVAGRRVAGGEVGHGLSPVSRTATRTCSTLRGMDELGHPVFDADNHYYEALDAFTRHLDPALGPRCVQWADDRRPAVPRRSAGGSAGPSRNATFDPVSKPGCLYDYFRGNTDGVNPLARLRDHEPIRPEYRDPDARLAALDEQGLAGVLAVPDPRDDLRGAAAPRPRGGVPHVPGVQPLAARRLGLRPRRPHLRRALPDPRRPGSGRSTSSSGRSARAHGSS